ncbi:MAG: cell wall hydrolase [Rhizobiaceae bacterium]
MRQLPAAASNRSYLPPLLLGLALWVGFPTIGAQQDVTSLVSGSETGGVRWNAFVERSVAGSVHSAEMPFIDDTTTGTISGAGVRTPGIGQVAFRAKNGATDVAPDEDRVARAGKKGRIVKIAPVAPPKAFNAGSVLDRTSFLLRPGFDGELRMAFAETDIRGKEIQIATAFYLKEDRIDPGVSPLLADLVTNDKADILATAYAPAEPDYARSSPFETLLQEDLEMAGNGRFIPPLGKGDHAWMSNPLPAAVFSEEEQVCLANGIYFEARGENLKGQAAVAQVILNRVRNPAYPSSICGVVYQNDGWRNRCQFSFACDGKRDVVNNPRAYRIAKEIAMAVTAGKIFDPEVGSSTHYYAAYVSPYWARSMKRMTRIGLHIFYRTYGGGWS